MVSTAQLEWLAQTGSTDFTRCGLRQAAGEPDVSRVLAGREWVLPAGLEFARERVVRARAESRGTSSAHAPFK
jgi:hypothetical protein